MQGTKKEELSVTELFGDKSIGQVIAEGLQEFADVLKTDKERIPEKFTCHKVKLDLVPTPYDPELVKVTRSLLNASQAVFAQFLGVSLNTLQAWEQGNKQPRPSACRLMDEIRHDPPYWRARMMQLMKKKSNHEPCVN